MPGSSTFAIKPLRIFDQDRCGLLRLTPFASPARPQRSLTAPAVFSSRVPKFLLSGNRLPWSALNPYWVARLAWSTLTPGPMVLETETFFK